SASPDADVHAYRWHARRNAAGRGGSQNSLHRHNEQRIHAIVGSARPAAYIRARIQSDLPLSNLSLHHDVFLARPTHDGKPFAFEERYGAGVGPVRVVWDQGRVGLDQAAATLPDRLERAAQRGSGDAAPAMTVGRNEAGDAPPYAV